MTAPTAGGSGTIIWEFRDDDIPSNDLLDTWSQSVTAEPGESGEIVSVSPSSFIGDEPAVVTVRVHNTGAGDDMLILVGSKPSGWTIEALKDKNILGDCNPFIPHDGYYDATFRVTAPTAGGSGTIIWEFRDDDIPSNDLLDTWNQSVTAEPKPTITDVRWEDSSGNEIPNGAELLDKAEVYLVVEAVWFSTDTTFNATIYENEPLLAENTFVTNKSLTHFEGNKWRAEWQTEWQDDGALSGDPEFFFRMTDYSIDSNEIHVEQRRAWTAEAGWSFGSETVTVAAPEVTAELENNWFASGIHLAQVAFEWTIDIASSVIDTLSNLTLSFFGPDWSKPNVLQMDSGKLDYTLSFGRESFPDLYLMQSGNWGIEVNGMAVTDQIEFDSLSILTTYFSELETHSLDPNTDNDPNAVVLIHGWGPDNNPYPNPA